MISLIKNFLGVDNQIIINYLNHFFDTLHTLDGRFYEKLRPIIEGKEQESFESKVQTLALI
jgi:hypothetical protein